VSGPGRFVVLEGGEGSGKSTQAEIVGARLRAAGREVVATFEPGATALGRDLRRLLLHSEAPLDPRAELLLLASDRAQHVAEVVRPAVRRGAVVVSDRYEPSTLAYQGVARGLGVDEVLQASRWASGGMVPDLVLVLDVPDDVAAARLPPSLDRMERAGDAFHAAVRAAYRDLAPRFGWTVLDGSGTPEVVAGAVWAAVAPVVGS